MSINEALDSLGGNLNLAKSSAGKVYWPVYDVTQIGDMKPGQGSMLHLSRPAVLDYP